MNDFNCTDFGLEVGNMAGMGLPASNGTWPGGGGSNPGTLGTEIKNRNSNSSQTIDKTGGNAPISKKGC